MNIVENKKLRILLSKGPSYREANNIDWGKVFSCIRKGIIDCIKKWCDKEKVDTRILSEWKNRLLFEVKSKIKSLRKHRFRQRRNTLDDNDVKSYLADFHSKFVITPTDKACNNFSIICKKFYVACLLKELCILENNKNVNSSTYNRVEKDMKDVVKNHVIYIKNI